MKNAKYLMMLTLTMSVVTTEVAANFGDKLRTIDGHRIRNIFEKVKEKVNIFVNKLSPARKQQIQKNFFDFAKNAVIAFETGDPIPFIKINITIGKNLINDIANKDHMNPVIASGMIATVDRIGAKAIDNYTAGDIAGAQAELDKLSEATISAGEIAEQKLNGNNMVEDTKDEEESGLNYTFSPSTDVSTTEE